MLARTIVTLKTERIKGPILDVYDDDDDDDDVEIDKYTKNKLSTKLGLCTGRIY
jgi:hypothetical protein